MVTTTRLSLDDFLALPETEPPSEFICGEVVQKPMPSPYHGILASELSFLLTAYLKTTREAVVMTEARHAERSEQRAYLPDIEIVRRDRMPTDVRTLQRGPLEFPADLAIEILSPEDRPGVVAEKLAFYLRAGTGLVWIVDPDERTIVAHRPGQPSTFHRPGDTLDAAPVLSAFTLDVAEFFAALDPPS